MKVRTCVLNMPMNEGQGHPHDSSGYGNNGTNNGADWVSGDYGWAMDFNGSSDYVNCGNDASLDIGADGAISCWCYESDFARTAGLISKRDLWGVNMDWSLYHSADRYYFRDGTTFRFDAFDISPSVDKWHNITINKEGVLGTFYLDGVSMGTDTIDATFKTGDTVRVGALGGDALTDGWEGSISEVRIYNRPLSAAEILTYFNATKTKYGL